MENGEKSFSRVFDILDLIASRAEPRGAREIARTLELPESTVYRMLKFMARRGLVERTPNGFLLGGECLRLGGMAQEQNLLPRLARAVLAKLAEETRETVHLARMQGNHIIYVDKIDGVRSIRMGSMIGLTSPLHCTGIGKAILAALPSRELAEKLPMLNLERFTERTICDAAALKRELELIRERGYAIDDCEHEIGVYCVASSVCDRRGNVVAGISVTGSSLCLKPETEVLSRKVRRAAELISAKL